MTRFTLNGREVSIDLDPSTPMLWAIRDTLGLIVQSRHVVDRIEREPFRF
jgi:aerobic-type carbon monoxide dehydrogenase small subunit (CoxS/CutS family)